MLSDMLVQGLQLSSIQRSVAIKAQALLCSCLPAPPMPIPCSLLSMYLASGVLGVVHCRACAVPEGHRPVARRHAACPL